MLATIASFRSEEGALAAQEQFTKKDIPTTVESTSKSDITVWALRTEQNTAREAFELGEHLDAPDVISCPSCGSTRVSYPARSDKFGTTYIAEATLEALHVKKSHFYCHSCRYEWE